MPAPSTLYRRHEYVTRHERGKHKADRHTRRRFAATLSTFSFHDASLPRTPFAGQIHDASLFELKTSLLFAHRYLVRSFRLDKTIAVHVVDFIYIRLLSMRCAHKWTNISIPHLVVASKLALTVGTWQAFGFCTYEI